MEGVAVKARRKLRAAALADPGFEVLAGVDLERDCKNAFRIAAHSCAEQEVGPLRQHLCLACAWPGSQR